MKRTRRSFISTVGRAAALAALTGARPITARPDPPKDDNGLANRIVQLFRTLPGEHALKIVSLTNGGQADFNAALNSDTALFCASAFKVFVLTEFLRMTETGEASVAELLTLNESVWSIGSPVLTPLPGTLTGQVNAKTALDAMIARSDNTATDILLNRVGADRVRRFIASIGLHNTRIPNTTRQFFGYVLGDPNWQTITFQQTLDFLENDPFTPNPIVNDVETMAVSPNDFVSFYSRALQGEFFHSAGTLTTFRAVLAQADAIPRVMPLGVNAFLKGGSIDFNGQHALSLAGGMFVPSQRWVHFGMIINWTDAQGGTVDDEAPQFARVTGQIFSWLQQAFTTC